MRVIVLGGGVIGVTSAYYLAQQGAEVTVLTVRQVQLKKLVLAMQARFLLVIRHRGQHLASHLKQ